MYQLHLPTYADTNLHVMSKCLVIHKDNCILTLPDTTCILANPLTPNIRFFSHCIAPIYIKHLTDSMACVTRSAAPHTINPKPAIIRTSVNCTLYRSRALNHRPTGTTEPFDILYLNIFIVPHKSQRSSDWPLDKNASAVICVGVVKHFMINVNTRLSINRGMFI